MRLSPVARWPELVHPFARYVRVDGPHRERRYVEYPSNSLEASRPWPSRSHLSGDAPAAAARPLRAAELAQGIRVCAGGRIARPGFTAVTIWTARRTSLISTLLSLREEGEFFRTLAIMGCRSVLRAARRPGAGRAGLLATPGPERAATSPILG